MTDRQYDNCISLGAMCAVASSMTKHGLRSTSGPFDWIISPFCEVVNQVRCNFF